MRTIAKTLAVAVLLMSVLTPGVARAGNGGVLCCSCVDCPGAQLCFNNIDDGLVCEQLCQGRGCADSIIFKTPSGCEIGPQCAQIVVPGDSEPSPLASPVGLTLAALLAFAAGANEVRRRARPRA